MNCKEGDIAIIVKANNISDIGKIVRCLEYVPPPQLLSDNYRWSDGRKVKISKDCWLIDQEVFCISDEGVKGYFPYAYDHCLRPLRDNDGVDETLTWKEVEKSKENTK